MKISTFTITLACALLLMSCQSPAKLQTGKNLNASKNPLKTESKTELISDTDKDSLEELFSGSSTFCEVIEKDEACLDEEI